MEGEDDDKMLEGIQADDEDNDQIETERAVNPGEKRQQELQRILQLQNKGASQVGLPGKSG
jgi:hypothetical protein